MKNFVKEVLEPSTNTHTLHAKNVVKKEISQSMQMVTPNIEKSDVLS